MLYTMWLMCRAGVITATSGKFSKDQHFNEREKKIPKDSNSISIHVVCSYFVDNDTICLESVGMPVSKQQKEIS